MPPEIERLASPARYRARTPLFRFIQLELPWALGPTDGRYLMRSPNAMPDDPATHVLVLATLGAAQRRLLGGGRRREAAPPEPEPTPVVTGRATVISVEEPFADIAAADRWLRGAGEAELSEGVAMLNRALAAFRVLSADPSVTLVSRGHALIARVGYGAGEEVAEGRWTQAVALPEARVSRAERKRMLEPQARFAAILGGHDRTLVCEELALRARLDLDRGRVREAALQLRIALDAGLAELGADRAYAEVLADRVASLQEAAASVSAAAETAVAGDLSDDERLTVEATLVRLESALRARAAAGAAVNFRR